MTLLFVSVIFFCVPLRLQFSMLALRLFVLPTLVQQLSEYIVRKAPELKGFSAQNLWRMKQFYETYHNADDKLSPLVRAEVQIVLFRAPADFNLWEEEEARQLHLLRSNLIVDHHFRRRANKRDRKRQTVGR